VKHDVLAHLATRLEELRDHHQLRQRREPFRGLSFSSNDYLGLARELAVSEEGGAGASRLTGGEHTEHAALEHVLRTWLGTEDVLLFSSGYAANVGALSALVDREDLVISDELNHASLIDGIRLARAKVEIVPHLRVEAVEKVLRRRAAKHVWVVSESYFSMDADSPDLGALRRVCDENDAALLVDEAHALGVFGPDGRGLSAAQSVVPDVLVGTLGKAFGASGAFVAGSKVLIDWLWNRARSHVFSTGMSPSVAATARRNIERARSTPALRSQAVAMGERFRAALRESGGDVRGHGPIVPWVLGSEQAALGASREFLAREMYVAPIRPPTVPLGTSRLRFTFTAKHSEADVDRAIDVAQAIVSRETT
jgi:8-amino-7-oxononanoate synthase